MKLSKIWQRFTSVTSAKVEAAIEKADQSIDIAEHANVLLREQKTNQDKIKQARERLVLQKNTIDSQIKAKQTRLDRIVNIIRADAKADASIKTEDYKQRVLTAAHEGPLVKQHIAVLQLNYDSVVTALSKYAINLGILDRNIMTIESRLFDLKLRNEMSDIKIAVYSTAEASNYFNIEKLEEIVTNKEIKAATAEEIHHMDSNEPDLTTSSAEDFIKEVLKEAVQSEEQTTTT